MMKLKNPWPPIHPQDEKMYDIELRSGEVILYVEFWSFGGGFGPTVDEKLVEYPLSEVVSFSDSYTSFI
jgi:hypothetical protein